MQSNERHISTFLSASPLYWCVVGLDLLQVGLRAANVGLLAFPLQRTVRCILWKCCRPSHRDVWSMSELQRLREQEQYRREQACFREESSIFCRAEQHTFGKAKKIELNRANQCVNDMNKAKGIKKCYFWNKREGMKEKERIKESFFFLVNILLFLKYERKVLGGKWKRW